MSSSNGAPAPRIPDYELLRPIGRGSYGEVWLARGLTGVLRAVKIVWRDRFAGSEPFEREFKGLAEFARLGLDAGNHLALHHLGRSDAGRFFYCVMELADDADHGRAIDPAHYVPLTFEELRRRRGRVPARDGLAHGLALARALADLHARGVVHRDIKPSNVIVVQGAPKLADIGLVAPAAGARTFIGTEGYVPPEGPGSTAADVYALGLVLYEITTGLDRRAFPQLPLGLADLADNQALLALNAVILRACDPSPARRLADGAALLAEFTRLQAGPPAGPPPRAWVWATAAAVAAALAALGFFATRQPSAVPPAAQATTPADAPVPPTARAELDVFRLPELPAEKSLVVLPLENRGTGSAAASFAEDLHEEIVAALARLPGLRTLAANSGRGLAAGRLAPGAYADGMRAGYLVHGHVRRNGDHVVLELRLRRAHRQAPEWTREYRFALRDLAPTLAGLAGEIARSMGAAPPPADHLPNLQRHLTGDPAAFDLFAQARRLAAAAGEGGALAASSARAEEAFRRDPRFGAAAALLAANSAASFARAPDPSARRREAASAREWAQLAHRLAPDGSAAGSLARFHLEVEPDYARAIALAVEAVRAAPGAAPHHGLLALACARAGRLAAAAAAARQAVDLDPLDPAQRQTLLHLLSRLRRLPAWERAVSDYRLILARPPSADLLADQHYALTGALPADLQALPETARAPWLWRSRKFAELAAPAPPSPTPDHLLLRAEALHRTGDTGTAAGLAAQALAILGDQGRRTLLPPASADLLRGRAHALRGEAEPALTALHRALALLPAETFPAERWDAERQGAEIHARLGRPADSLALLAALLRQPSGVTVPVLKSDPAWDPLRGRPEFEALLADPQYQAEL